MIGSENLREDLNNNISEEEEEKEYKYNKDSNYGDEE
jgi:hypothetical protein